MSKIAVIATQCLQEINNRLNKCMHGYHLVLIPKCQHAVKMAVGHYPIRRIAVEVAGAGVMIDSTSMMV